MRLVAETDGVVEIRWTWLPFWLAMNPELVAALERDLRAHIRVGEPLTDALLDSWHDRVVAAIEKKFPNFTGLSAFLNALKEVQSVDRA